MILTCPECATRYLAKEGSIGPNGRTVRCSKCKTTWFVASDLDELALKDNQIETITAASVAGGSKVEDEKIIRKEPVVAETKLGAHVDIRDRADSKRRGRRMQMVALIWLIPLLFLSVVIGTAYVSRQEIVNKWPKTATLYKQFGIDVSLTGLVIEDPIIRHTKIENKSVLVVNGAIRNISSKPQNIPLIKLSLHDVSGQELSSWSVDMDAQSIDKNDRISFVSEYPNPPLDMVALKYQFDIEDSAASTEIGEIPHSIK